MVKKGQAAMEFLMTYGWAILIVLIALGALFFLGVFEGRTANTCIVGAPLTCTDVLAAGTAKTITLVAGATGTNSAQLTGVTVSAPTGIACTTGLPATISKAAPTSITVTCTGTMNAGDKITGTGTATYQIQGSSETHTTSIQFGGTIE